MSGSRICITLRIFWNWRLSSGFFMAGSQIERVFNVLESLASDPHGWALQGLAEQLQIPKSATHRLLAELTRLGYVRQNPENLRYPLSTRLEIGRAHV